jgi:hypothetical protein
VSILLLLVVVLVLAVAGIVVLVAVAAAAVPTSALPAPTGAARRHAVLGGTLAVVLAGASMLGMVVASGLLTPHARWAAATLVLGPAVAGAVHSTVLLATELTWPRPVGTVRSAAVVRRGVRDIAPRALTATLAVLTAALVAGVLTAGLVADDSEPLSVSRRSEAGFSSASPFPDWSVGLPALAGVAVVLGLTALVLQRAVTRPAVAGADLVTDRALRRASAHRALRGAVAATALTLGPLLSVGALVARNVAAPALGPVLVGVAVLGLLVIVTGLVALCLPAPAVPPAGAYDAPDGVVSAGADTA